MPSAAATAVSAGFTPRPPNRAYQVRADPQAQTCSQNCGPPGRSGSCLWRVPWFRENALLQVDGRDDDPCDDGAGRAAGESQDSDLVASETCSPSVGVLPLPAIERSSDWSG